MIDMCTMSVVAVDLQALGASCRQDGCVPFSGKLSNDFMKQQCGASDPTL